MGSTTEPSNTIYQKSDHVVERGVFYRHPDGGLRHYFAMAQTQEELAFMCLKEDVDFDLCFVEEWYRK